MYSSVKALHSELNLAFQDNLHEKRLMWPTRSHCIWLDPFKQTVTISLK